MSRTIARMVLGVAVVTALAGCTSRFGVSGTEWAKPGAAFPRVTLDEMDCARRAEAMNAPDTIIGGLADAASLAIFEARRSAVYRGCMTDKGYRRTDADT